MNQNKECLETYYTAFKDRNAEGMIECYHDDATFTDPVFIGLDKEGVSRMWTGLLKNGKDLTVAFSEIQVTETTGSARWTARYTFSSTQRMVVNHVDSSFEFKDGKIHRQVDSFDFYRWAKHAFGPIGWLIGWTSFFRKSVQSRAMKLVKTKASSSKH